MRAFAITWDGSYRNLMVAAAPDLAAAKAAVESARSDGGIAVGAEVDLDKSGPALVALYNALAALASVNNGSPIPPVAVARFATRGDGQKRIFALLESNFKDAPEAAAPPTVESPAANSETETNEEDMAAKGKKKSKKVKAAGAAKKERKPKKDGGAKVLVREDSSRGKLLKLAVNNPGISVKSLATRAEVSSEGSASAENRAKMRLRKVAENVGGTVDFGDEGKHVTFKLPAGTSLDKIFGR